MPEEVDVESALRTLEDALALEPSAGFEARVRSQLARRRAPRRLACLAWILAAAAVLMALALAARAPRGTAPARLVHAPGPRPVAPEPTVTPQPVPVVRAARALVHARPRPIVPHDGMARLARYVSFVRAHPLGPELLARDASAPLAEPRALAVHAIEITPLESTEGSPE